MHVYKVPNNTYYGAFRENIFRIFNIPSEQVQFCQNKAVQPDTSHFDISNTILIFIF